MDYYIQIILKLIFTVVLLMAYIKISGKSQLAPMSAFDQIGNMVVGALGGSTLLNADVSILHSTIFMAMWILILLGIRLLRSKSVKVKELIDGKRMALILDGKMQSDNFSKAHITISDVEIMLHEQGITGLHELQNVWFETNGEITFSKKGETKLSHIVIEEGVVDNGVLEHIEKDMDWLEEQLKEKNIDDIKDVFCAEWVEEKLWVYEYK